MKNARCIAFQMQQYVFRLEPQNYRKGKENVTANKKGVADSQAEGCVFKLETEVHVWY